MLDIYYQNVRGIRTKTNDIYNNVTLSNYPIIALTETWLNDNICNREIFDSRYIVYRRDRCLSRGSKKDGGGVLVAVSRNIPSARVESWESECEDIWVTLQINCGNIVKRIALCVIYLPPPVRLESLGTFLENASNVMNHVSDVVIMGDLNLSFIKWTKDSLNHLIPSNYNCTLGYTFVDFITENDLKQVNAISNVDGNFLDVILTNIPDSTVVMPTSLVTKVDQKHPPLLLNVASHVSQNYLESNPRCDFNFFKADYEKIITELKGINWNNAFSESVTVNDMLSTFYELLSDIIAQYVPKRRARLSEFPPWFDTALKKLLSEKNSKRLKYKKYKNPRDKLEYEILRSRCQKQLKTCYKEYVTRMEDNIAKNPKLLWNYVKNKRKGNLSLPGIMYSGVQCEDNGPGIANLFASHFSSVYSNSSNPVLHSVINSSSGVSLGRIKFTERQVLNKIKRLDALKGAGPDKVPPLFVKRCGKYLALPLCLIINRSFEDGVFPDEWKKARIVPVYKKGEQNNVKNYRPISILSCFSKLCESLLCPIITQHMNSTITPAQHGFITGRSVQTNLVAFVSDLSVAVDRGKQIDAIYTDFSSAFDKVSHSLLLSKLESYGIYGNLLNWFQSYLFQRPQMVSVKGYDSEIYFAKSGVPQGSHLGPILFTIFINDITNQIRHCKVSLYADDLKIHHEVDSTLDIKLIQNDLDRLLNWCQNNFMTLNATKCYHIKYTKKRAPIQSNYNINGTILQEVNEIRDLGVIIDSKLTFSSHINAAAKRGARMLGFIKRNTKEFRLIRTKKILYNSLVLSHLEFASEVWSPIYAVQSQRIESVQRAFTRHLAYISSGISHRVPYYQRLNHFKMNTLNNRRKIHDILFLHKLLNGMADCNELVDNIKLTVPTRIPRYPISKPFHVPFCRTNVGKRSPLARFCGEYNSLCGSSDNLDIFHDPFIKFKRKIMLSLKLD